MIGEISIDVIELQRLLLVSYPRFAYAAGVALIFEISPADAAVQQEWHVGILRVLTFENVLNVGALGILVSSSQHSILVTLVLEDTVHFRILLVGVIRYTQVYCCLTTGGSLLMCGNNIILKQYGGSTWHHLCPQGYARQKKADA